MFDIIYADTPEMFICLAHRFDFSHNSYTSMLDSKNNIKNCRFSEIFFLALDNES